jgi:formyl-CoA transferase
LLDAYGQQRQRLGGRMEGVAPSNAYRCQDGRTVIIAGNGDAIFRRFMDVIGRPDLGADPALAVNDQRWLRRDELDEVIGAWTAQRDAERVLAALAAAGVPAGPIYRAADISGDPQYTARSMVRRFDVPVCDRVLPQVGFPGVVPRIGDQDGEIAWLGPDLGAHTRQVLGDLLQLDDGEIDQLYAQEVI